MISTLQAASRLVMPACMGLCLALLLPACSDAPPSWDTLITAKITSQYPGYTVTTGGEGILLVARPGLEPKRIDAKAIGEFCRRGPRDCDYAVDQALLELQPPQP